MGMNINNPVCAPVETVTSPTPPEGMRGLVAKGDGWYDYTSDSQQEKILDEGDVANELPASNGETLWSGELTGKLLDKKVDKVTGKTLSSNDFTDEKKEILDKMSVENRTDLETGKVYPELHLGLEGQYDSVSVKGLYGDSISTSGVIESKTDVRAVIFDEPNSSPTIHKLTEKANAASVLTKTNADAFTPTGDYHPATKKYVDDTGNAKVDKVEGKVLSSNDFTDANKETLDYITFNQGKMIITGFGCRVKTNHNYFGDSSNSENHFRGQNDFEDGKLSVWKPSATSGGMPPYHTKLTGDDVIIYRRDDVFVEEHRLSKKEDIFTVQNGITGSSLVLTDHTDTRLTAAAVTALTVTLPETIPDTYAAAFSFVSGTTATALTASGIKWQGADCNAAGVFIPAANTNYEVSVKCIGFDADSQPILVARVGVF